MSENFSAFLYLIAATFFILALRGLSSAKTSIKGNIFGMIGMGIAIVAAFAMPKVSSYALTIIGIIVGGAIGALVAKKIEMTALPQLVAAFHSLVGLAAVLVAAGAMSAPVSFKIGTLGHIMRGSLVEIGLGTAVGAVTFTGSVVAFLKLQGLIGSKPLILPNRHLINVSLGALILFALVLFVFTEGHFFFWVLALASFALGLPNPPKITLIMDRFIALHIIWLRIAPEAPTKAPVTISSVLLSVKPMPDAAQPEYEFSIDTITGMSAPPTGSIISNPSAKL